MSAQMLTVAVGSMQDEKVFYQYSLDDGCTGRDADGGPRRGGQAGPMGSHAGHGLWLRQGRQDVFLQDGHKQRRTAPEGSKEGAQRDAVLHRTEWTTLHAHRTFPGRRR